MSSFFENLKAIAECPTDAYGVKVELIDLAAGQNPDLAPIGAHLLLQIKAAIRTLGLSPFPVRLVFVLNQTGEPIQARRTAESYATLLAARNFIASFDIDPEKTSDDSRPRETILVWLDDLTVRAPAAALPSGKLRQLAHSMFPVLADVRRQWVNRNSTAATLSRINSDRLKDEAPPEEAGTDTGERTILFCLYWLDFGGAEAFAIQAMQQARDAGYRVVVACDELGRQSLLEKAGDITQDIYVVGNFWIGPSKEDAFLKIIERHRPRIVHIHHSWTAYRLLPAIRRRQLCRAVIDTTHILEHRHGGFVAPSLKYSEFIDRHHVISGALAKVYADAGVPSDRVRLGRLHDMSGLFLPSPGKWTKPDKIRVAFVGRFTQQKRPYLMPYIVRDLVRRLEPEAFRFDLVGEGQLYPQTQTLAKRLKIDALVNFWPGDTPIRDVLAAAHVLIICSDNEGLALVGFEAIRSDCLVISTDVGAQRELIPEALLVPAGPLACVRQTVRLLTRIASGRFDVAAALKNQHANLDRLLSEPSGASVVSGFYRNLDDEADRL